MSIDKTASSGYVFYDNLGEIGNQRYWSSVRKGAQSYFSQVEVVTAPGIKTASFLNSMGKAELEKEKQLLIEYFGIDAIDWNEDNFPELIKAMNRALNIEAVFARVVERLSSEEARAEERDTVIASVYGDYLEEVLNPKLDSFFDNQSNIEGLVFGDAARVGEAFETMILESMDEALTKLLQRESDAKRGDTRKVWEEALDAINEVESFRREFGIEFFKRYGFDKVKAAIMKDIKDGLDYESLKDKVVQHYKQKISGRLDMQTTAGYVAEKLGHAFQMASTRNLKWTAHFTGGQKGFATDKVTVLGEGDVDFTSLTAATKIDSANSMREFHQAIVNGMKNTTIIYENTKKYNLGKNFRGFSGGTRPLDSIGDILSAIGYSNAEAFINKVKQTMSGAIYAGSGFRELAEESLAAAVGHLLFDDIDNIGQVNSSINTIHIFRLSDIVLPLSFLLISIAEAMADAEGNIKQYVNVSINVPGGVAYGYPQGDTSMSASALRWEDQASIAAAESTVTINFLSGFKSIIGSLF